MSFPANPTVGQYHPSETSVDATGMRWQFASGNRWLKKPLSFVLTAATANALGGVKSTSQFSVDGAGVPSIDALTVAQSNQADQTNATAASNAASTASTAVAAAAAALAAANAKFSSVERSGNDLVFKNASGATINTIALGDLGVDVAADNLSIDGNFVMTFTQTNGGGTKTVDLRTLKSVNSTMSLSGDGDGTPLKLVGDAATPGPHMVYGTDGAGAKGFSRTIKIWTATPDGTAATGDEWHDAGIITKATMDGSNLIWLQVA